MIKTFRGQLADGAQRTIRLSTNKGETGYRIVKFQCITTNPGIEQHESVTKIFTNKQTTITGTIDFDNSELLAANAYIAGNTSTEVYDQTVIFDNVPFNQDIFITHAENDGSSPINFYLELEQIKLNLNEATVATLKDMRGSN
tara:strand:+ start:84 stop:512 length:429 start_codon:yes stop_codon:yes gene_type:complete